MSRYGRAVYGTAKYGLDLWSQYSVEPMVASITVDPEAFVQTSSFTDSLGNAVYDRVQTSWLDTSAVDTFLLMRSNLGYPTSPADPFSKTLNLQGNVTAGTGGFTQTYTTDSQTALLLSKSDSVSVTGLHPVEMNVANVPVTSVNTSNNTFTVASTTTAYGVANGDGSLGANVNFLNSSFTYATSNPPPGCTGYFLSQAGRNYGAFASDLIPFDPNVRYTYTFSTMQAGTSTTATTYGSIAPYDSDQLVIGDDNYAWISGSLTTLAAPLNPGDTVIQLTSSANWTGTTATPTGYHTIQFWNYVDGSGKSWGTDYTRNVYDNMWADGAIGSTNTITLNAAWAGPAYPAGTQVSNALLGNTYFYMPSCTNVVIPATWTQYSGSPATGFMAGGTGAGGNWNSGMPVATAYFKVGWLLNYSAPTNSQQAVGAITVTTQSLTTGTFSTSDLTIVASQPGDPQNRFRRAYLDTSVVPGSEYFYAIWVYLNSSAEWILAGRASTTTSNDHGSLDTLKSTLPAYMWNQYSGPGDGVAVLDDSDNENHMTRWLQSCAWELDQSLTKIDLLRSVWNPQQTPAILLDEAVSMFGLPVEPALGERSMRALMTNAATITGMRGSIEAISELVESLTGFSCPAQPPNSGANANAGIAVGSNLIANTDESSFEGLLVAPLTNNVVSGTGRWHFENSSLVRIGGDTSNTDVKIARDPNSDDDWGYGTRYGLHIDAVSATADITMSLGEHIKISTYTPGTGYSDIATSWVHGLEEGDVVSFSLDGGTTNYSVTVMYVIDNFTVRVTGTSLPSSSSSPTDGYLFGGMIPVYQGVPVQEAVTYALVGKFMSNNTAGNLTLGVTYYDQYGNSLGTSTITPTQAGVTIPVESNGAWTQLYVAATSPAGAVAVTLSITLPQTGSAQYLDVDSLMVKSGGTPYNESTLTYDTSTPYQGATDYTYEDARLVTITIDTTTTSASASGGNVPTTIQSDLVAVIRARITEILAEYLPASTAFKVLLHPQDV